MDETLANIIFTELLLKLMEQNKVYKVKIQTEIGERDYNLIRDEEDNINIYDQGQVGTA